ncbi:MAG: DUF4037 domain-containing protein [Treponema sp.]|jgi:hypothetical protein|nr:DUF4037 domain-containing protein [Treponema sp.]
MKYKTKMLADRLVSVLSQWPGVECVSLNEAALPDTLDPYFALILDVFYTGVIPEAEERNRLLGEDIAAFESAGQAIGQAGKDRFLVGEIPVRIEYKSSVRVEELVSFADSRQESLWLIKDSGTYGFYRLAHGDILFSRTGWIDAIRARLRKPNDAFWARMREAAQSKMEHFLGDLGAALAHGDDFYYLISSSGFIKFACFTLFCLNRRFEPSHRAYYDQVIALPKLPASFPAELENFLMDGGEMTLERRYALAQIIAKGIVAL